MAKTAPKGAPPETDPLAALDAALEAIDAAPLLHKGEAATVAVRAARGVLASFHGRLVEIERLIGAIRAA